LAAFAFSDARNPKTSRTRPSLEPFPCSSDRGSSSSPDVAAAQTVDDLADRRAEGEYDAYRELQDLRRERRD
jgi:hypothetical protein